MTVFSQYVNTSLETFTGSRETMDQHFFINAVRSLFNIDGYLLPELTREQQGEFLRDPVRYFIRTDKVQQDAIYREVAKRQAAA